MTDKRTLEKIDLKALPLVNEEATRQFVLQAGGYRVRMEYDRSGDRIFITHTDVPKALDGRGAEGVLAEKVLAYIEAAGLKLVPLSPHMKAYLRAHPAWKRLLVKGLHV